MPGLSATVAEQIEALRRVAGENAVKLIKRVPDPVIDGIVAGWPRNFEARVRRGARLQGRKILRRDHPRPYRGRARRHLRRVNTLAVIPGRAKARARNPEPTQYPKPVVGFCLLSIAHRFWVPGSLLRSAPE
jgi:hypothetical protein